MNKRKIILTCSHCGARNYTATSSVHQSKRLELNKFCPTCKTHILHKQTL